MSLWFEAFSDSGHDAGGAMTFGRRRVYDERGRRLDPSGTPQPYLHGLGRVQMGDDLICVEGDCQQGQASVTQLQAFFASSGSPSQFQAAVDSIVADFNDANDSLSRKLVPFSTACCRIKQIGFQADGVVQEIANATGQKSPGTPAPAPSGLGTVVKVAAVAAGGWLLVDWLRSRTRSKKR